MPTSFARVVVGVDDSEAGLVAARQAARLARADALVEVLTAVYVVDGILQGWPQEQIDAVLETEARPVAEAAVAAAGRPAEIRLASTPPKPALLAEAGRIGADLLVVGTHDRTRVSEYLVGGVAGPVLRDAACSVLVARPAPGGAAFPAGVVAGVDGSAASIEAAGVGAAVATRLGVPFRALLARHAHVDLDAATRAVPAVEVVDGRPVGALCAAVEPGDLLVVGSRGLHGVRALGSVSERVAHRAASSVLVVK